MRIVTLDVIERGKKVNEEIDEMGGLDEGGGRGYL